MEKMKALVIDDELVVRESVSKILTDDQFEVTTSSSGRIGLERAVNNDFDIVLTDIRMPDIGGLTVLRDIKRAKPQLPVVMITGYATVKSSVQAMKLGATDYLEKPFTPEELIKTVKSALHIAATQELEDQGIIHKEELLMLLERAATDNDLTYNMLYHGSEALEEFNLTGPEKLAVITGDINWIEKHVGKINATQKKWLEQRQSAEIW